jgi:hypothetical protein
MGFFGQKMNKKSTEHQAPLDREWPLFEIQVSFAPASEPSRSAGTMRPSPPNAAALSFAQAPCPSPVGNLMNTSMNTNYNRQSNPYGIAAPNKALELLGSPAA